MRRALVGLLALALACGKDAPTEPPPPPPPPPPSSVSLRAKLQAGIMLTPPYRVDSMRAIIADSVLSSTPGVLSRCYVWPQGLPPNTPLRYVLFVSDTITGQVDSAAATKAFPTTTSGRHAWATVEEFYGPGQGIYAVLRSVAGECSLEVGGPTP